MKNKYFFCTLLIIAAVKLFLVSNIPMVVSGFAAHDDFLYINLASSILTGDWLGHYNELTLIRGVVYPLFIAFNYLLGLPLFVTQHFLFIFAGLVFLYTISNFIKNYIILVAIFIFYVFVPIQIQFLSVIREGIYIPETVILFSTLFGLIIYRDYKWALFAGIALVMVWFTREEGIWVLPSVAVTYVIIIFESKINNRDILVKILPILCLPIIMLLLFYSLNSLINNIYYDTYVVNELKQKSFLKAYGALTRVKPKKYIHQIPLQFSTMDDIAKHSPTFSKIKPLIIEDSWNWARGGEIGDGMFIWVFRHSVKRAGYYKSAKTASQFFELLGDEINALCGRKALDCEPIRETLSPPFKKEYLYSFPKTFYEILKYSITSFQKIQRIEAVSVGEPEDFIFFQTITGNTIFPPKAAQVNPSVSGWAFKENYPPLEITIKSLSAVKPCSYKIERTKGTDVVQLKGPSADWSRFRFETQDTLCCISVYDNSSALLAEIPLKSIHAGFSFRDNNMELYIDNVTPNTTYSAYSITKDIVKSLKPVILDFITIIYSIYFYYLCFIALSCYLINLCIFRKYTILFCFSTVIVVGILSRITMLSIIQITSFNVYYFRYVAPITMLFCIFIPLSIIDTYIKIRSVINSSGEVDKKVCKKASQAV
ncbi:MAG: hypothetical protein HQL01_09360 [Nitrospirae bacterium]|nr:hypothetical protein [Nitrospirota bacterium]